MRTRTSRRVRQFIATCATACMLAFTLGAAPATAHETSADTTAPEAQAPIVDTQQTTSTDQATPATAPTETSQSSPIPDSTTTLVLVVAIAAIAVAVMPDSRTNIVLNRRRRRAMSYSKHSVNDFTIFNRLARIVDKAISGFHDRTDATTKNTRPNLATTGTISDNREAVGQWFGADASAGTINTMAAAETADDARIEYQFTDMMAQAGLDHATSFAPPETSAHIDGSMKAHEKELITS